MKNTALILWMALAIAAPSAWPQEQAPARKTTKTAPRTTAPKNEEEIIHDIQELEKSLRAAFVDGKSNFWDRHLDEHYAGVNPDGKVVRKADLIQLYGSADLKYDEVNLSDMSARIYGDCVIATTQSEIKGSYKGQDFSGNYYFVHVWVKEGQEWKLAQSQATKLQAEATTGQ